MGRASAEVLLVAMHHCHGVGAAQTIALGTSETLSSKWKIPDENWRHIFTNFFTSLTFTLNLLYIPKVIYTAWWYLYYPLRTSPKLYYYFLPPILYVSHFHSPSTEHHHQQHLSISICLYCSPFSKSISQNTIPGVHFTLNIFLQIIISKYSPIPLGI